MEAVCGDPRQYHIAAVLQLNLHYTTSYSYAWLLHPPNIHINIYKLMETPTNTNNITCDVMEFNELHSPRSQRRLLHLCTPWQHSAVTFSILSFLYADYLHWSSAPAPRGTLPLTRGRCAVVLFVVYFSAFYLFCSFTFPACWLHSTHTHLLNGIYMYMYDRLLGHWLSFAAAFMTFLVGNADFLFVFRLLLVRLFVGAGAGAVTASACACLLLLLL